MDLNGSSLIASSAEPSLSRTMGPDSSPATSTLSSSPRSSASSALASSATDIGVFVKSSFVSAVFFAFVVSSPRPRLSPPTSSNDASEPEEMPRNPKPSAPPTFGSSSRSSDRDRDGGRDGRGSSFVFSAFVAFSRLSAFSSSRFKSALSACSNISRSTSGGADTHFARRERSASLEYDVTEAFAAAAAAAASSSFRFFSSSFSRFFRSRFSLRAASLSSLGFSPSPG
mmetsp:Transcript_6775/g.27623  ORF Transcript_6775/g.27623 Transcript_6775/m.27623 type:complete len:228 (+) Transcript_6775:210-893(+)